MIELVGVNTGKVYRSAQYKAELFRWMNVKYKDRPASNDVNKRVILPEPMEFVKVK